MLKAPDAPQLVILDWMMPHMDGLQVCKNVRNPDERPAEPYVYIILLTAKSQKTDMVTGLEAGADDYLTKPFDAQELRMRLRAGRRILDLLAELVRAREIMREQSRKDSLTQLCTRATVLELLKNELDRSHRDSVDRNVPVSVVLADLDHFKHINDTYGHLAGDAVLRETAHRMRQAIRPYDNIGCHGGEEFLLVLSNCDTVGATTIAERRLHAIRKGIIVLAEGTVSVALSAGVATSGIVQDAETLVGAAEAALYRAKRSGRKRVAVATSADSKGG